MQHRVGCILKSLKYGKLKQPITWTLIGTYMYIANSQGNITLHWYPLQWSAGKNFVPNMPQANHKVTSHFSIRQKIKPHTIISDRVHWIEEQRLRPSEQWNQPRPTSLSACCLLSSAVVQWFLTRASSVLRASTWPVHWSSSFFLSTHCVSLFSSSSINGSISADNLAISCNSKRLG